MRLTPGALKQSFAEYIAVRFCFRRPGAILCSSPALSRNIPALFLLEKAELALCAEPQPAPAGNCATGYRLLAIFAVFLRESRAVCVEEGMGMLWDVRPHLPACRGQCSLSGLKVQAPL